MESTAQAIALSPKQRRQAERKRLRLASLNSQLAWWASPDRRAEGFQDSGLRSEVKRLQKAIARLSTLTPSSTWADDARSLPLDRGGDFPPKDGTGIALMTRARGERCFYPPSYLTSSGHSFDVYVHAIVTGTSEQLTEDGYMGGRVTIRSIAHRDRERVRDMDRRRRNNTGRMLTNVL